MDLSVGEKVAYPNQGVCVVESIRRTTLGNTIVNCYTLRLLSDNSTILVPLDNAENIGIRPVISPQQCKKLIRSLSADFEIVSCDWKSRSKEFAEKLRSGDLFAVADVLKKLTFLSYEKKLSFREQTLLDKSRSLILSEILVAEPMDEDAAVEKVDKLVAKACEKHQTVQPRVMNGNNSH
ncbi:MAG: CarD family transcriptional regulator [Acidobacteria bacterium]|nr:CarD family transcriptional regulator [Acidobacteriota bacterium]